jgi:tetratricopeptide (TPR) repeat protein
MKTYPRLSRINRGSASAFLLRWLCTLPLMAVAFLPAAASAAGVSVSDETIVLPTYLAGEPEPDPMFYFGRVSQGAQGRVYPYPLYDSLTAVRTNKSYRIVYLENEYVRIGVLPEIGGRLFEGVDKSNGYDFIYRQHVIKPALIGLIGAWMSGGIEWNVPHHHRASTFIPVQDRIEENADGSKTIWVGELELRDRMRWAVGYTLHPGKSYLECSVRVVNRTPLLQSMLCFANVAVHVNEHYQVIFPPGTEFVTHHHKREFTTWPIATGRYGGYDFGAGVDASWYTNHVSANSMFAWNYQDDFFAGYDHGREAGLMSIADHHVVPGKKLWTWGNGPRGRMWDKILTDDDGPYIELMVGAYSDNQPDYSWLQPYETKSVQMFWYPFRQIGGVKKANLDAAVNLEVTTNGLARIGFCTTSAHPTATALLQAGEQKLWEEHFTIDPAKPFFKEVSIPSGTDEHGLRASLSVDGKELVAYSPIRRKLGNTGQWPVPAASDTDAPPAAVPAQIPAPRDVKTVEELLLTGQRIQQFHDAGHEPEPYWEEALRRDPGDARVNTALGIRQLKQARFTEAEQHLRKAIERLTANYTVPKDGEPLFYLGLALLGQGKRDQAFDVFFDATWSQAWRGPAYYALAEIATRRTNWTAALDYLDRSLEGNALNIRALNLKAAVLRHTGHEKDALAVLDFAARKTDPLDVRLAAERWLAGDLTAGGALTATLRAHPATGLETATEYGNAGLWADGTAVLTLLADAAPDKSRVPPLAYYYLGQFAERLGDEQKAAAFRQQAAQMSPDYCFPFQWEAIHVLRRAMELNPRDARAPYYLGNLLFDWQPEEAVKLWEQSAALDPSFPIVHRNLALAYSHQQPAKDTAKAIAQLELAVAAPSKYAMHFAELDDLYAEAGRSPEARLELLERNQDVVLKRDDSLSREIGLKVFAGQYDQAIQLMTGRKFSVWEGGTLDVADHWVNAHLLRGQEKLQSGQFAAALADFQVAKTIPDNLPSDRRGSSGSEAELAYLMGAAYDSLGDQDKAKQSWQDAAGSAQSGGRGRGRGAGGQGFGGNRGVQRYYQALAQQKLGQSDQAKSTFRELVNAVTETQPDPGSESTPAAGARQNQRSRLTALHYAAGLGHLGLGETDLAKAEFTQALEASPDQPAVHASLKRLE